MNEKNLKPVKTSDEARKMGRKGGIASGKSRRERSNTRKTLEAVLNMPITNKTVLEGAKEDGIPLPSRPCYMDYIVAATVVKTAQRGQMADLQRLMEILGEETTGNEATLQKARELLDGIESVIE